MMSDWSYWLFLIVRSAESKSSTDTLFNELLLKKKQVNSDIDYDEIN
jgi:hypothetical protein